jgi:hypothetical protein
MQERPWALRALKLLVPITALLLVVQYIAGLGTNVYAPVSGFNGNSAYGWLDFHYITGDILGVVSILLLIVAVFTARAPLIGNSVGVLASVVIAGIAGMAYVNSTPNNPVDSLVMGVFFLAAFGATISLGFRVMWASTSRPTLPSPPAAPSAA